MPRAGRRRQRRPRRPHRPPGDRHVGAHRHHRRRGARGRDTAYLQADDGNTSFYAHFSQFIGFSQFVGFSRFIGEARTVARGEVIGRAGMTGDASAPHLHLEVRIGGDDGATTDPSPMLNAAGC